MEPRKSGLWAINLRVRVSKAGRGAGRFTAIPGGIGFAQGQGKEFENRWVDVMAEPSVIMDRVFDKGDVIFVTGRYTEGPDREYGGKTYQSRTIWAESIEGQAAPNDKGDTRRNDPGQSSRNPGAYQQGSGGYDGAGFPDNQNDMDSVPF